MIEFSELKRGDVVYIINFSFQRGVYEVLEMVFEGIESEALFESVHLHHLASGERFKIQKKSLYRTREEAELLVVARILSNQRPRSTVL